ncbi:Hly-III-related protein [Penicillium lividum]|nr:Hly-III-related protein [Penicillium lividum]
MPGSDTQNRRDCAMGAITSIFGLSYFFLFVLQFLLFHFPSSQDAIIGALAVIFFGAGVIVWCLCSLFYCVCGAIQSGNGADWQRLEWGGGLFLIWTATLPTIVFLFPNQPCLQIGYLSAFTVLAVGNLLEFLFCDPLPSALRIRFPYHCASLGLLSLVPSMYTLAAPVQNSPTLAVEFSRMVMTNILGATLYLLRPLERLAVVQGWRPSIHTMRLVVICSLVTYSKAVMQAALRD